MDETRIERLKRFRMEFPAASTSDDYLDRMILQGHADACAEFGHASWVVDGKDVGRCPRCGEVTSHA